MANEITITAKIKCTNGELIVPESGVVRLSIDQATQGYFADVIGTTTTFADLPASVTAPGMTYFKNLDATNDIYLGTADSQFSVKLKPGEVALFRCHELLGHKASAGTPSLQLICLED